MQHPMRPCVNTTSVASKKSLRTPPWPSSNNKKSKTNIDDLPDVALIEILARLPHSRILFQCKCVCKCWSSLISNDELRSRYLWHQSHSRIRNGTLIFRDPKKKREFSILPELELPMFKSHNFSLRSFLPCFQDPENIETEDDEDEEPVVLGVCNDLVLCCATMSYQCDYYICNPYTKQYVQVPPSPICRKEVTVGFICDPYVKEQVDQRQDGSYIQVDVDFRFAIVRILKNWDDPNYHSQYKVEIFSSETGRWTQSLVETPYLFFPLHRLHSSGGIAHNGMLYWWSAVHLRGFIGLDPYSNNNNNPACFYSIDVPREFLPDYKRLSHLISVCPPRGRLR